MTVAEVHQLPLNEKLQIMEAIWEDLCRNAENFESPEWHREVLEERQKLIDSGQAKFLDWEQAKADVRKRVS